MRVPFNQVTDAMLERSRESIEDRMYREYYHLDEPDPVCKMCKHFVNGINQCERFNDDESSEDYGEYYVDVDPDDDACDDYDYNEDC